MNRRTAVSAIVTMMEMGPEPVSGMGGQNAMGSEGSASIEVGMEIMPGDDFGSEDYDDETGCGFHPDDYVLAKQLVAQVGSVERARELLENLDEVYETLDLVPAEDEQIAIIAGQVPDEPDYPTDRHMLAARQTDPGQY